jgi:hypothetical protein
LPSALQHHWPFGVFVSYTSIEVIIMANKPDWLQALLSVLAAFFGVQSERNREHDFSQGRPLHYVLAGLLLALVFVLGVILLVRWVLSLAGV